MPIAVEAGADVAIVDLELAAAEQLAEELSAATGRKALAVQADSTDPAQLEAAVERIVAELGPRRHAG